MLIYTTQHKFCTSYKYAKPGKDPAETNNYRPIGLTSCLCKTLERMINKRLTCFLESYNHIPRFQSGFKTDRSTTDDLVRLETFIRDAFIKKGTCSPCVFRFGKKLMIPHGDTTF